uniref:Uncharacterized protein n=1 Tax=Cacopsylla melanoneura TaxID=428564 RepID=A0A8D9B4X7_9HEMI
MSIEEALFLHVIGEINDDDLDLAIMHHLEDAQPRQLRAEKYGRFNLEDHDEKEVWQMFRFKKEHIPLLQRLLHIPEEISTNDRGTISDCRQRSIVHSSSAVGIPQQVDRP